MKEPTPGCRVVSSGRRWDLFCRLAFPLPPWLCQSLRDSTGMLVLGFNWFLCAEQGLNSRVVFIVGK